MLVVLAFAVSFLGASVWTVYADEGEEDEGDEPLIPQATMYYRAYSHDGNHISSKSGKWKSEIYVERNALYGTYGELSVALTDELFNIEDDFILEFAPVNDDGELAFSPIEEAMTNFDSASDEDASIMWHYSEVGVYKITVCAMIYEDGDDEKGTAATYEYFFVCGSAKADPYVAKEIFMYNDMIGDIEINVSTSANWQPWTLEISQVVSDFDYEIKGSTLIIKKNSTVKNATHQVSFKVSYDYYKEVYEDGKYTPDTVECDFTVALTFVTRPHVTGILDVFLGVLVLAFLGGVVYGISYITKRMQQRQDTLQMGEK